MIRIAKADGVSERELINQLKARSGEIDRKIDSIQTISTETLESSPGSIAQVRECSASILRLSLIHI